MNERPLANQDSSSGSPTTVPVASQIWNVPNTLSTIRLVMAWVVFAMIEWQFFWSAFVLFVIAVGTDWIDGWYARKYNQVTQLGRILDPFCDKVIICGTFIQVAAVLLVTGWPWYIRIMPWVAVVVVARELLVTALRSAIEAAGGDFSASFAGKLKMLFQCIAVGSALVALALGQTTELVPAAADGMPGVNSTHGGFDLTAVPGWVQVVMAVSLWAAVWTTLSSGWDYVIAAIRFARRSGQGA